MYRQVNEDKATVDWGYMALITRPWWTTPQALQMGYREPWEEVILNKAVTLEEKCKLVEEKLS